MRVDRLMMAVFGMGTLTLALTLACGPGEVDKPKPTTHLENTSAYCKDGLDNDGDGKTDCQDDDCISGGFCAAQWLEECGTAPGMECASPLVCSDPIFNGEPTRCFHPCDASGSLSCPNDSDICLNWADPMDDYCVPGCNSASDCSAYSGTFCWELLGYHDVEAFCYPTNNTYAMPCDASHPCDEDYTYGGETYPLTCAPDPTIDQINDVCVDLWSCSGEPEDYCRDMYSSWYWCVNGECVFKTCATALAVPSNCGEANSTCFHWGGGKNYCLHGGDASAGAECSGYSPTGSPYIDPLCNTNLDCYFTAGNAAQDGICVELCKSVGSPACSMTIETYGTSCVYDSSSGTSPYQGICGVPCSGEITYTPDPFTITGDTASDYCSTNHSPLNFCYFVEFEDDGAGTLTINKGYCGY